jgi:hypothetical protein
MLLVDFSGATRVVSVKRRMVFEVSLGLKIFRSSLIGVGVLL